MEGGMVHKIFMGTRNWIHQRVNRLSVYERSCTSLVLSMAVSLISGEKPYVCTVQGCGKRFTEYSSLYKHHVVHTHSKPYMCNYCHKTYRQTSTLAMHKRTAHGEDTSVENEAVLFEAQNQGKNKFFSLRGY